MTRHTTVPGVDPVPITLPPRVAAWFAAAVVLAFASSVLLRTFSMPLPLRFAATLLPTPALVGLIVAARRLAARLDEFEQRVQLEALAWAFGVAAIAFLAFSQLQVADMLGPEDWFIPWFAIGGAYLYGLLSARRRYQ